jgi:hypothetical protein
MKRIEWALGDTPPGATRLVATKLPTGGTGDGWLSGLFKRPGSDATARAGLARNGMGWAELPFGDSVPTGTYLDMSANLPVVDPLKVHAPVLLVRGEYDGIARNRAHQLEQRLSGPES